MHICLCSDEFPPDTAWGGIATYVFESARALSAQGHRVTVVSVATNGRDHLERLDKITVVRLALPITASQPLRAIAFAVRAAACVKAMRKRGQGPDIIEFPDWLGQGILHSGCATVIRLHGSAKVLLRKGVLQPSLEYKVVASLEAMALRSPAALLANSRRCAAETRTAFRISPRRPIGIIPCGVNTTLFRPVDHSAGALNLLFVGRLDRAKGAPTLFAAVRILLRMYPHLRCTVVGSGFGSDASARRRFHERADWLACDAATAAAVRFVGQIAREDIVSLYQQATVVVVPSLFESFGYVALEAMACGRPVVMSTECGIAELVEDSVSAYLVGADDAVALADRVSILLKSPEMARAMGRKARDLVVERCCGVVVARRLAEFYEQVVSGCL
jgi:glycogen(starch) synthase